MPTFADAYISSLGYLRPYVLFENNGELASEVSAEGEKKKSPTTIPLRWRSINPLRFIFITRRTWKRK